MGGRRRRDDGWDEGRGDRQDGWREPWPDQGRDGWPEQGPGRADGRHRAALPAGGGWPPAADQSAGGAWPPVTGYQAADAQGGYQPTMGQGGYQTASGQGGYQPAIGQGGYQAASGQGGYQPAIGQGGASAYGDGRGYGAVGYRAEPTAPSVPSLPAAPSAQPGAGAFPGDGQGFAGPGNQQPGFQQAGYAQNGYSGAGFAGHGVANGAGDTRYADQGGTGYGQTGAGYSDAGDGGGGWFGGGSRDRDPGHGQPAPGGSRFGDGAAYDAGANGRMSGSYAADTTVTRRPDGEFPETSATAQYGRLPSWGRDLANEEYGPAGQAGQSNGTPSGTPRPYGRLSIFTLLEDKAAEFDRLAEQASEGVRTAEPDTLVYVIHVVPKAPMQRIIYEIYRDRQAFESHERQPHIQRFVADRKACVLATNIIDLRLKYAKVAALSGAPEPAAPDPSASVQETRVTAVPRALDPGWPAEGGGQYAGPGYGRFPGSSGRVPQSRPMDWDQPAYQGQRRGGN